MRAQTFVPLLATMAIGAGAVALSLTAAPPSRPYVNVSLNASTLRFQNRGQRLTFQTSVSNVRLGSSQMDLPVLARLRWLHADLRPVENASVLSFQLFPTYERLPAHLVFDSNNFPDVRRFLQPQNVPLQAEVLEITLDATDNYYETNESDNRYRIARPLPDLYLTHAQALPDEDTAWFVLRNQTGVPVVQPIVADLTWLGQNGVALAGPYTWTVWPGPGAFGNQTPLVQLWGNGRANTGVIAPPLFPRPAATVALRFDLNPLTPADAGVTPILERDRDNNTATVLVAPDLIVSRAVLLPNLLTFTISTVRGPNASGPVQVLFQWITSSGQPTGQPVLWVFNREGGVFPREFTYNTRTQRGLHRGIFGAIPADASHLRITVNPVEDPLEFPRIVEVTDQNNSVTRPRP